jgi:segregation and condensation protein B
MSRKRKPSSDSPPNPESEALDAGRVSMVIPVAGEPDVLPLPEDRDVGALPAAAEPTALEGEGEEAAAPYPGPARAAPRSVSEIHLKGIIESLVFVSERPLTAGDIARIARAEIRDVRRLLDELRHEYRGRGVRLDEIAGGWQFRSSAANAPFVRELLQAKPVKLTRAQIETLAIVAYRQPITRPEIDEIRGVDSGSALKVLLDRDLVRMLGRKEDVGRPVLYGTSNHFLEFFGLKSLRDLPTLREFTDLTPESEATLVRELGDVEKPGAEAEAASGVSAATGESVGSDAAPGMPAEPTTEAVAPVETLTTPAAEPTGAGEGDASR